MPSAQLTVWLFGSKRSRSKAVGRMLLFQAPPRAAACPCMQGWVCAGEGHGNQELRHASPSSSSVADTPQTPVGDSQHGLGLAPVTRVLTAPGTGIPDTPTAQLLLAMDPTVPSPLFTSFVFCFDLSVLQFQRKSSQSSLASHIEPLIRSTEPV